MNERSKDVEAGTGSETTLERKFNHYVGNTIHLFLSVLAVLLLAAAAIAAFDTLIRDFPKLLAPADEYKVLQDIIQNILLIAIAAEFGILLLYRRPSAAVEVVIFVVARKLVSPNISALDLLLGAAAIAGLVIVRFYYLPGEPK